MVGIVVYAAGRQGQLGVGVGIGVGTGSRSFTEVLSNYKPKLAKH